MEVATPALRTVELRTDLDLQEPVKHGKRASLKDTLSSLLSQTPACLLRFCMKQALLSSSSRSCLSLLACSPSLQVIVDVLDEPTLQDAGSLSGTHQVVHDLVGVL